MDVHKRIEPWLALDRVDPAAAAALGREVVVFPGCVATRVRSDWLDAAQGLLRLLGHAPGKTPVFECCGCTLGHAGLPREQTRLQRHNVQAWRDAGRPVLAVFCATCRWGLTAYANAPGLDWEPGEAEAWRASVTSLIDLWGGSTFRPLDDAPATVLYHQPCHGSGDGRELAWLQAALGGRLARWNTDRCCGMGGVMQLGAPDLSRKVAADCWASLPAGVGGQLLTGCSGCVLQLKATAPEGVAVGHWLETLRLAD